MDEPVISACLSPPVRFSSLPVWLGSRSLFTVFLCSSFDRIAKLLRFLSFECNCVPLLIFPELLSLQFVMVIFFPAQYVFLLPRLIDKTGFKEIANTVFRRFLFTFIRYTGYVCPSRIYKKKKTIVAGL